MEITEETKIKDLIPEGYEYSEMTSLHYGAQGQVIISYEKKKSKTLDDYEREFQDVDYEFGTTLKDFCPKLYYTYILQMIADDICEKEQDRIWWLDYYELTCRKANYGNYPLCAVFFDTEEHAKQAIKLMGDKLKLLI